MSLRDLSVLAKCLEELEDADIKQDEATLQDPACRDLFDCIKDVYLAAEDRLEVYAQRAWQAKEQVQEWAELKGLLERLQVELFNQKQSLEDMAEYVEGTMAKANLCIAEWEEN